MKKLLGLFFILFCCAGCNLWGTKPIVKNLVKDRSQKNFINTISKQKLDNLDCTKVSNIKQKTFNFFEKEFILPKNWLLTYQGLQQACVQVANQPFNVYLHLEAEKNPEYVNLESDPFENKSLKTAQIEPVSCGGAMCFVVGLEKDRYYINFFIQSTQPPPDNLQEIWTPDNNVSEKEFVQVLETIHAK